MRLGSYTVSLLSCFRSPRRGPSRRSLVGLVLLASLASFGCGGKHQEAKVAEADPWAGYKGTYATGAADPPPSADDKSKTSAQADTAADAKPGKKPKSKRGKKGAAADAAAADPPAAAPAADKPASADASSPSALYGDGSGTATTTSGGADAAATPPKKPKKKAAKKKKPAAPAP